MVAVNPIDKQVQLLISNFKKDPTLERRVQLTLERLVRRIYADAISQNTGYCMIFKIPEADVLALAGAAGLSVDDVKNAFSTAWNIPKEVYMANNPYYHLALLFTLYGIRTRNESFQKTSMTLLLVRLWNGRLIHFIPYCNPDTMRYVVANLSGKYYARKYDTPMTMIVQHFVPTLLATYSAKMDEDSNFWSKRMFDQSFVRLEQLFIQNRAPDLKTGIVAARSGLAPAYYSAKEQDLKISKPTSSTASNDDDRAMSSLDYYSSHEFEELIHSMVNFITMNINPNYDKVFLEYVIKDTTVNSKAVEQILNGMHDIRYADNIRDILELTFKQLNLNQNHEVCSKNFLTEVVKKKLISSKHSTNIVQLKKLVDMLLERIFADKIGYVSYSNYSNPRRGHLRKVVFYGFAYNMQKYICSGSGGRSGGK